MLGRTSGVPEITFTAHGLHHNIERKIIGDQGVYDLSTTEHQSEKIQGNKRSKEELVESLSDRVVDMFFNKYPEEKR
jgi:hypothetical protein